MLKLIFLYLISLAIIAVTILELMYHFVPEKLIYELYIVSAGLLCFSLYYLIKDLIYLKTKIIVLLKKHNVTSTFISDYRYRTVFFNHVAFFINIGFAIMNGICGLINQSWWFLTFAVYYTLLSVIRAWVLWVERKNNLLKEASLIKRNEWKAYFVSGIMFFLLSITLAGTVILITSNHEGKSYSGILIFAVATYTFYKIILAIINLFKARKLDSPLIVVIRYIGYCDALVSLILLQTAMFSSFSKGSYAYEGMMNLITGIICLLLMLSISIFMIYKGRKYY